MAHPFDTLSNSIQNIIQFKENSADSIQKIIQFNSQEIIYNSPIGKVPKNYPKVSKIDKKKGVCPSKMANIDSKYNSFIHFTIKFNSKDYSIVFNSKFYLKIWIWLYSIQQNIHSTRKPGYRTPLISQHKDYKNLNNETLQNKTVQYCPILTQYHQVPTSTTLNWSSTNKY